MKYEHIKCTNAECVHGFVKTRDNPPGYSFCPECNGEGLLLVPVGWYNKMVKDIERVGNGEENQEA